MRYCPAATDRGTTGVVARTREAGFLAVRLAAVEVFPHPGHFPELPPPVGPAQQLLEPQTGCAEAGPPAPLHAPVRSTGWQAGNAHLPRRNCRESRPPPV